MKRNGDSPQIQLIGSMDWVWNVFAAKHQSPGTVTGQSGCRVYGAATGKNWQRPGID